MIPPKLEELAWKTTGMRPMIHYIQQHKHPAVGVEVGVWQGVNAENILNHLGNLKKLLLVDPYMPYVDGDKTNHHITDPSPNREIAKKRLNKYVERGKAEWWFTHSLRFAEIIDKESLDFVYLDGNHTYENVTAELEAFWPLIKNGGVLGGHDIHFYGVMQAVGEFAAKHKLHPQTDDLDWWIEKP